MTKREKCIKYLDRIIFSYCLRANCEHCNLHLLGCCINGNSDNLSQEVDNE